MRGREPRTALDVLRRDAPSNGNRERAVRERNRQYQTKYRERHDRTATAAPAWEVGDWVRVRRPVSGRVEGQPAVQIESKTGPVSYKVSTGDRVHARRLVPGRAGDATGDEGELPASQFPSLSPEVLGADPAVPPVVPPATELRASPERSARPSCRTRVQSQVEPDPLHRGGRRRRSPDRYSPDNYR